MTKAFIMGKRDVVMAVIILASSPTRPKSRTTRRARITRTSESGMSNGPALKPARQEALTQRNAEKEGGQSAAEKRPGCRAARLGGRATKKRPSSARASEPLPGWGRRAACLTRGYWRGRRVS